MSVEMIKVKSSNLSHIGFDPDAKEIHVTFENGGKTWKYFPCTQEDFDDFQKTKDSLGSHFHHKIKSVFDGEEVKG